MPRLRSEVTVAAPYETVRPFYERADGLAELSPSFLEFTFESIEGPLEPLEEGSRFETEVRFGGVGPAVTGTVEITDIVFDDSGGFVEDTVIDGPFEFWRHRRSLEGMETGTRIIDDLRYRSPPGGPPGRIGAAVVLDIAFRYRRRRLHRLFGRH